MSNPQNTDLFKNLLTNFITEEEIPQTLCDSFKDINILSRSYPGLEYFTDISNITPSTTLNTGGKILSWISISGNIGIAKVKIGEAIYEKRVFVKIIHLLDPFIVLKNGYLKNEDKNEKINRKNNQAYIDCITASILSKLKEIGVSKHLLEVYGAVCGIQKQYKFNITDDYNSLKDKEWFWEKIGLSGEHLIIETDEDCDEEIINLIKTVPFEFDEESDNLCEIDKNIEIDMKSVCSFKSQSEVQLDISKNDIDSNDIFMELESCDSFSTKSNKTFQINKKDGSRSTKHTNYDDCSEIDIEELIYDNNIELYINFDDMPVLVLFQEAADGTLSDLVDIDYNKEYEIYEQFCEDSDSCEESEEEEDAVSCAADSQDDEAVSQDEEADDSQTADSCEEEIPEEMAAELAALYCERDERWPAWLFQIIAALTQLQSLLNLCHNDLHSSNIMWKNTKDEYLYYKSNNGTAWKVPTYGKIFYIIDFGRATFEFNGQSIYSDDYMINGDAHGQYNYGELYTDGLPEVKPNRSFDLCRLSTSMLYDLFIETPISRNTKLLYKEGDWEKHITISDTYNLLWKWVVDSSGKNLLINKEGEELYTGFDLYIKIAATAINAIPKKQLNIAPFSNFINKSKKHNKNIKYQSLFI